MKYRVIFGLWTLGAANLMMLISSGVLKQERPTVDLRIGNGKAGSAYEFSRIGPIALSEDGSVYVVEMAAQEIRKFGSTGSHVWTRGRQGQGTGEFVQILNIGLLGDTLFAVDTEQQRIVLFHSTGQLLGTRPLDQYGSAVGPFIPQPWFPLPNGMAIGRAAAPARLVESGALTATPILVSRLDSTSSDTLAWIRLPPPRRSGSPRPPSYLRENMLYALSASATRLAIVSRLAAKSTSQHEFGVFRVSCG